MSMCNSITVLIIIVIILIVSIILAILYKIQKDNNQEENNHVEEDKYIEEDNHIEENKNIKKNKPIEKFTNYRTLVQDNNIRINALIDNINNIPKPSNMESIIGNTNKEIDDRMKDAISQRIRDSTNNMIQGVNNKDIAINKNITKLSNQLTDLENMVSKLNLNEIKKENYSKIKSLNNGAEVCLFSSKDTNYIDPVTGTLTNGYMVNMNKGCLSVGTTEYDVYKCNDKNRKQLFKMEHIINDQEYEKHFDKATPYDVYDKSSVKYPFVMLRSVNNNNCLTNQNGNITVQPCFTFKAQRWLPL